MATKLTKQGIRDRKARGLQIAATCRIDLRSKKYYSVPSQSTRTKYIVDTSKSTASCTCPDHQQWGADCKHIYAVMFSLQLDDGSPNSKKKAVATTKAVEVNGKQRRKPRKVNHSKVNRAAVNEKYKFRVLLSDLCKGIEQPVREGRGRPPIPLCDALYSAVYKVYSTLSTRRFMTDLRDAHSLGYLDRLPCYNSIFRVLESSDTTPLLLKLVTESATPLSSLETHFSPDSSGFSASRFDRWHDKKHGGQVWKRAWVKAHIVTGVNTNIITAVEIRGQNANDAPFLPSLLKTTSQRFNVEEVSADMGYISERNLKTIVDMGATPYIPFKSNAKPGRGKLWSKMFHYYHFHREEFLDRYHLRSNVESTFSMVKARFGDSVRSRLDVAMKNEVLAKILCHNIVCVIRSMYLLDIDPVFWND